jgi:hypothetical protein
LIHFSTFLEARKVAKETWLKILSVLFFEEKYQKNFGLKYFTKNSAPFHCSEKTRYAQTLFLADISLR